MRSLFALVFAFLAICHKRSPVNGATTGECSLEDGCFSSFQQNTQGSKFKWVLTDSKHNHIVDNAVTSGKVMVATISRNFQRNDFAQATQKFKMEASTNCLAFRYYMYDREGCDVARLTVDAQCGSFQTRALQESGSTDANWNLVTAELKGAVGSECTVTFKAAKGLNKEGKVAVDGIAVYPEPCPTNGQSLPEALECNFQTTLCDWKNEGELNFQITEHALAARTGPTEAFDRHTSSVRGKYIIVSSAPGNWEKSARLVSPRLFSKEKTCMRFVANMNGVDVNKLEVLLNDQAVTSEEGNKGNQWFEKWIDLPANRDNKVAFVVSTGKGPRGNIAIDDVIVQRGDCKSNFELAKCAPSATSACPFEQKQAPCIPTYTKVDVNGVSSDVLKMEHAKCERKEFYVSWTIAALKTPRQSCLSFDYMVVTPENIDYRVCSVRVEIVGKRTDRVEDFSVSYEGRQWLKYKKTINKNLDGYTKIRMKSKMQKDHCEEFNVANLRLTSGPCA